MKTSRFRVSTVLTVAALIIASALPLPAGATTLWYSGDYNGYSGLANEVNSMISQSAVYECFTISGNDVVTSLWSNNMMNFTGVGEAVWAIRTGVGVGDGGTLIAGGISSASQSATGGRGFGFDEYTIRVSGLNIRLAPGTYWLTVAPVGFGSGRSFIATSDGRNGIGLSPAAKGNSFWDSTYFYSSFAKTPSVFGFSPDFSMGIEGDEIPTPEPATLLLFGAGAAGAFLMRKRFGRQTC